MKWITLYNKLGKQPIKITQNQNVNVILYDKKTHSYIKKFLCLKIDKLGNPYFVEEVKDK